MENSIIPKASASRLTAIFPVVFVFTIGILISSAVYIELLKGEANERVANFESHAANHILSISNRIKSHMLSFHALSTFLETTKETEDQFAFMARGFSAKHPAVLFYAVAMGTDKKENGANGNLLDKGRRDMAFPISLIVSSKPDLALKGVDISSAPPFSTVFAKAYKSGEIFTSPKTSIGDGKKKYNAIIILKPLFRNDKKNGATDINDRSIFGFSIMAIDLDIFFAELSGSMIEQGVNFQLYDLNDLSLPPEKRLLYVSERAVQSKRSFSDAFMNIMEGVHLSKNIFVGQRRWSVVIYPAPQYGLAGIPHSLLFLAFGLTITILLAAYFIKSIRYYREIEQTVQARTMELYTANKELAEEIKNRETAEQRVRARDSQLAHSHRLATVGEMGAAMAHELNQPLTGIMNYAENGIDYLNLEKSDIKSAKSSLAKIVAQVRRVKDIVAHLKGFSKKDNAAIGEIYINDLLENALELVWPQLDKACIVTVRKYNARIPPTYANDIHIEQVLLNVINNAIDAMHGSKLKRLEIMTRPGDDNNIIVEISDTGEGLKEGEEEKIFNSFYSTKPSSQGTGLGLSISRRIVAEYGGSIRASNNESGGATFAIELPVIKKGT